MSNRVAVSLKHNGNFDIFIFPDSWQKQTSQSFLLSLILSKHACYLHVCVQNYNFCIINITITKDAI